MSALLPRLMLAAPASGSGKTVVACALLRALQRAGFAPAAFKCGPDYLDPTFHRRVVGARAGNLDAFFCDAPRLRALMARGAEGCDVAVLEGVMGYYDGMAPGTSDGSSCQVASWTGTPTVLVVNARGASLSLAALVQGFARFRPDANVQGVILNRCSARAFEHAAQAVEEQAGVAVLGYVPQDEAFALESRHLGLVAAGEVAEVSRRLDAMAEVFERTVDVGRLLALARTAPAVEEEPFRPAAVVERPVRLAVARDDAFCFHYEENLRMLEDLGAELAWFSPLSDRRLPAGSRGLYLGGGYPELHARALSENVAMRQAVRQAVAAGMPTVAECGGFLYLQRELRDEAGVPWEMAGVLPGASRNEGRLRQFGYVELTARRDGLYGPAGTVLRGHEFHYWHSTEPGADWRAAKPRRDAGWPCMVARPSLSAGFPHVYYPANPEAAVRFVRAVDGFRPIGRDGREDEGKDGTKHAGA